MICDEFVQIKKTVIDAVLRKFKAGTRNPPFYQKEEYHDVPREPNCETYISSASYKSHWSWEKFKSFFKSMVGSESYCVVGLPYQLPVMAGYYPKEQIIDEMSEADFDSVAWSINISVLLKSIEPLFKGCVCYMKMEFSGNGKRMEMLTGEA